jgi:glycosyltransferase involved in cell wall biosynthesis
VLAEYGPTAVAILKICKQLNIPLVAHFHGYDASERTTIEKFGKSYRELFNYAAAVVAVSNKMITDLNNLGCAKEKIYLSPCGPSADFFQVKPLTNKKQFVAIGRFVEKKAPHLTLAAFKIVNEKHPDSNLVMIGEGELLSVCKHFAELWGMKNKVEFRGIQTADNIRITLSESIAFVQHSVVALNGDSEGTPVAVMEASAASLPVIATKHAGINDVIVNGQTGFLVEEKDVNSMAEYMIRIIEQPDLARKMGEAGRKNIKENFSLEKNLSELKQILKKAATI